MRLRSLAQKAGIPLMSPVTEAKSAGEVEKREHWAKDTPGWKLLSADEREEEAEEADFSTHEPLFSWFDAAAISVADRSVTSPNEATKELNRRLEIVESLASAPLMFGMTGSELEDALSSDASHWLAARERRYAWESRCRNFAQIGQV